MKINMNQTHHSHQIVILEIIAISNLVPKLYKINAMIMQEKVSLRYLT